LVRSCSGSSHRNQEAEPWSDPEDFCEDEELEMAEASSSDQRDDQVQGTVRR
jgi:hypothetical protein